MDIRSNIKINIGLDLEECEDLLSLLENHTEDDELYNSQIKIKHDICDAIKLELNKYDGELS